MINTAGIQFLIIYEYLLPHSYYSTYIHTYSVSYVWLYAVRPTALYVMKFETVSILPSYWWQSMSIWNEREIDYYQKKDEDSLGLVVSVPVIMNGYACRVS